MLGEKERYQAYLCSPEWWQRRDAVMERAGGRCEKCHYATADHVHHLTYIRKYHERLEDLIAICEECHTAIHRPKRQIPEEEEKIRSRYRRKTLSPLEAFLKSDGVVDYPEEARELGLQKEYEQLHGAVVEKLQDHDTGTGCISLVLAAKVELIRMHRQIDNLNGFSGKVHTFSDRRAT